LWTLLFPIILGTLFKIAIPDATTFEKFKSINIAVINNDNYKNNEYFKKALTSATKSKDNTESLFNVQLVSQDEAESLLQNNKIIGYILVNDNINLYVKDTGINQTIANEFINSYLQINSQNINILKYNQCSLNSILTTDEGNINYLIETPITNAKENNSINYFYALLGMACLYGGFMGSKEIINIEADQSSQGARITVSPINKLKLFTYSIFTATVVQVILIFLLIAYLNFALGVDFGSKILYVILTAIAGAFTGVSFGAMIASILKGKEGLRTAILLSASMIMSFLAGLMSADMKYFVQKNIPILSLLNPANLISDSFYSLYCYNTYTRYFMNIGLLFGISVIFYLIVFFMMRRKKYASI
jgi:ABC-2 type transport system permease protein